MDREAQLFVGFRVCRFTFRGSRVEGIGLLRVSERGFQKVLEENGFGVRVLRDGPLREVDPSQVRSAA